MKKIKLILPAILLFVGLHVKAAIYSAGDEKFKDYQDATLALVYNDNRWCYVVYPGIMGNNYVPFKINELISKAENVTVSEGEQPILTFGTDIDASEGDLNKYSMGLTITTDATYKIIKSLSVNLFRFGRVNSGDLLNPIMTDGLLFDRECELR